MSQRVSSVQIAQSSLYGIASAYARFDRAQTEINTGKQVQQPSDDPSGTAESLNFREQISEIDQFGKTMSTAKGFMSTAETALDSVNGLLRQARSIAVQGASDDISTETRTALSSQLQNIIDQVGALGNTTYGQRFVFAGQRTQQNPFVAGGAGGYVYQGGKQATGDGDIVLDIGRGEAMTINSTGDQIFSPLVEDQVGPPAVKAVLTQLRDDVAYGASDVVSRQDIANLDTQINNVLTVRADLGAKIQRIDATVSRNDQNKVNFTKFISNIEDTDIPKAVVEMQTAQTAYQAALSSTARAFQNSLLDFLR